MTVLQSKYFYSPSTLQQISKNTSWEKIICIHSERIHVIQLREEILPFWFGALFWDWLVEHVTALYVTS